MPVARILVVEDDAITAHDIQLTLEKLGYSVAAITDNGIDAVSIAEQLKPDLVLMDIRLKGDMDGIDAAKKITLTNKIPIVYLSAHHEDETVERSKSTSPYGYLLKPLNDRDLNACLRLALFRFEAEKKLKESEDRFKALSDVAASTIIIIEGSKFIYANPHAETLIGYSPAEILNMNFWEVVHPDFRELVKERGFARQNGDDVPSSYEFKIITKSGKEKWVQTSATLTEFDGKKCTLAIVFDITGRKKSEETLMQSEEKFRAVSESMPAQIVIFQGSKFVYANPYSEIITGYSQEELQNMNFWDLVHDDFKELARERGLARQRGENITDNYELKIITKSGEVKWINYSARIIDYQGKPAVLGIATDINESKKIQETIKESEERYRAFIEQSTEGIYRNEAKNPININLPVNEQIRAILKEFYAAECNDVMAKMYGLSSSKELIGRNMNEFLIPDDPGNIAMIKEFIENNYRIVDSESNEIDAEGRPLHFSNNAVGIIENGMLLRIWGIQKDVTLRKKMEQKLSENVEYANILNYFTSSMMKQETVEEILWDVTQNCFSKLSFEDCSIYLIDENGTQLIQKAAYGRKNIKGYEILNPHHLKVGEGIVGSVAISGKAEIVDDTSKDSRYIVDDEVRLSEITVPIINEGKVIGVIDSEHPKKGFFTEFHLNILMSIASLCSNKIVQAIAQEKIRKSEERYRTFVEQSSEGIFRLEFTEPVSIELALDEQIDMINSGVYIAECNDVFARMYGENKAEDLTGKRPNNLKYVNTNEKERGRKFIMQGYKTIEEESAESDSEGNTLYFVGNAAGMIENGNLTSIWGVQRDITEKKKSEEALKNSLKEKEILLKEIHHRVKNNLQIVTSLLKLQSSYVDDDKIKQLFRESQNRVQSMSLIHQKLYQAKDLSHIDFKEYIETVTTHLQHSYGILEDRVQIEIDVKNIVMSIDNAIPAGLIINELVSNSLKHAFPDERPGKVFINVAYDSFKEEYWLVVRDNGIGFSKPIEPKNSSSFGLKLVSTLVEQMPGTLELVSVGGSEYRITFKSADYKERK